MSNEIPWEDKEEVILQAGLLVLVRGMRERLRAGVHPDAVQRWMEAQISAASDRLTELESGRGEWPR
jgi:hypothetical protein